MDKIDENYKTRLINALTIPERIEIYSSLGFSNFDLTDADRWMNTRGTVSESEIYSLLEMQDINSNELLLAFKDLNEDEMKIVALEAEKYKWFKDNILIFNDYLDSNVDEKAVNIENDKLDMSLSIVPFEIIAYKTLKKMMMSFKNIKISEQAIVNLIQKFSQVLLTLSIKTLVWEMQKEGIDEESDGSKKFIEFVKENFLDKYCVCEFYKKYPVISRRLSEKCMQLINHYQEMLTRLDTNFEKIQMKLGLHSNIIERINCEKGDTHQQGRFVIQLFLGNTGIYYKPRNLDIQKKFYDFARNVSLNTPLLDLYENNVFYGAGYTFESDVVYEECKSLDEVKNFYKRFGQICAFIYCLKGNDIHFENIVAHGEYPVIIDIETLFQHQADIVDYPLCASSIAYKECIMSIGGTALIPILAFSKDGKSKGVDISALNGKEQTLPYKMLTLINANRDNMHFDYDTVVLHAANNIPVFQGEKVPFENYVTEICMGFEKCMNIISDKKVEILNKFLPIFKGTEIRHLMKATQNYAKMMSFSSHPNYSVEMPKLERMFYNVGAYAYKNKSIVPYEIYDMVSGDIPLFYGMTDSCDIYSSGGRMIEHYFETSSYEKVYSLIQELDSKNIDKQLAQIKVCLGLFQNTCMELPDDEDPLVKSGNIAYNMIDNSIVEDQTSTITWNNVLYDDINMCWKIRPVDESFAYGLSGIGIFLEEINALLPDHPFNGTLSEIKNTILNYHMVRNKIGIEDGFCGVIAYCIYKYRKNKDRMYYENIYRLTSMVDSLIKESENTDTSFSSGISGVIVTMANIYCTIPDKTYYDYMLTYSETLYKKICNTEKITDFTFETGIWGEIYALDKANIIINSAEYNVRIRKSVEMFVAKIDLDVPQNYLTALLRILQKHADTEKVSLFISKVMHRLETGLENDSLINGTAGYVDVLLDHLLNISESSNLYKEIYSLVVNAISKKSIKIGTIEGYPSVGFFGGLAGYGYELLRLKHPTMQSGFDFIL